MICVHLRELFHLCQENEIRLSSSDLVRVVCNQCGAHEVCPSALTSEFGDSAADDTDQDPAQADVSPQSNASPRSNPTSD